MLKWIAYSYILLLSIGFGTYYTINLLDGYSLSEITFVSTDALIALFILFDSKREIYDEAETN